MQTTKMRKTMASSTSPIFRRRHYLLMAVVVLVPFTILFLFLGPDLSAEQTLSQRLAELQIRLQYLESMYRARQEDVAILSQYLGLSSTESSNFSLNGSILEALSPEARTILRNMTSSPRLPSSLRLPTAFNFLPHLLDDPTSLRPAFLVSKGRQGVSVVLGVPTVKRDKQSYLLETIHNLVSNMNEDERNDTIILIFIGETEVEYVTLIAREIEFRFGTYLESGLIEILSPPLSYYPNMDNLRITLNDPLERVKWRSKQNLDFAFLMTYAQFKGTFYVQLEDDILTKKNFISIMKKFALEKSVKKYNWFVLDFCQLGFIGKLFKSAELPWVITFLQMFYNDKPADWLLEHLVYTKICNWEKDMKHCKQEKTKLWLHFKPSLFQHIGTTSSLRGKVQKLKDKQFGKVPAFYPHENPKAVVKSAIAPYKTHTIQRAYNGETFFWGLLPQPGDLVEIVFSNAITVKKYLFRSGNAEYPSDKFYNTTIEVLPSNLKKESPMWNFYNITSDGFLIIGCFNSFGIAQGIIDSKIGKIKEIRLHVHSDSENYAILSEGIVAKTMAVKEIRGQSAYFIFYDR